MDNKLNEESFSNSENILNLPILVIHEASHGNDSSNFAPNILNQQQISSDKDSE